MLGVGGINDPKKEKNQYNMKDFILGPDDGNHRLLSVKCFIVVQ